MENKNHLMSKILDTMKKILKLMFKQTEIIAKQPDSVITPFFKEEKTNEPKKCPNCGKEVKGRYCPQCGLCVECG